MEIGDLVWAKIGDDESLSISYRPGLIQGVIDSQAVLLSFFDCQNPSYFRSSQLRPLADHRGAASDALLDWALRRLCRRTALSLSCRCLVRPAMAAETELVVGDCEAAEARKGFRAEAVAEFVRSKAVLPWVEVGDFVSAVRSVAQVQVFRDYNAAGQRLVYRKKRRRLGTGTRLVDSQPYFDKGIEESYNMELDCGGQATQNQLNKKMKSDALIGVNPVIFPLEDSNQSLRNEKLEQNLTKNTQCKEEDQSVYGMLLNLQFLALDSSSLEASCLKVTEQAVLRYRNFLFKKVSDVDFHKCSLKIREAFVSNPCYAKVHNERRIEDHVKECESEVFGSILPYVERPVRSVIKDEQCKEHSFYKMLVNLQHLGLNPSCSEANYFNVMEQACLSVKSFLLERVSEAYIRQCSFLKAIEVYFSNPCYVKGQHRIGDDEKKCQGEVFGSMVPYMTTPTRRLGCKRQLDLSEVSMSAFKSSKTTHVFSIDRAGCYLQMGRTEEAGDSSSTFWSCNDIDSSGERRAIAQGEAPIGDHLKLKMLNSSAHISTHACNGALSDFSPDIFDFSLSEESNYLSNIVDNICKDQDLTEMDTSTLHFKLHDRSFCVLKNRMAYADNIVDNRNHGIHNADAKSNYICNSLQPSATESTLFEKCNMLEANASDVANVCSDKAQMQLISGGENAVISNREIDNLNVASEDRINEIHMLNNFSSCTSGLLLNSCETQQSKAVSRFSGSTSLHLKFPKNMNLPSKEKLMKKFRRFGPIDSLKTKIFGCSGSAQVVFFKQLAAMAAYHYARGKKLLPCQPNVHCYWFDPFEEKRREAELVARKSSVLSLKSCLRNSNPLNGKVEKKPQKVRFLMET